MSLCPSCTTEIPDDSRFCGHCGSSLTVVSDSAQTMTSVPVSDATEARSRTGGHSRVGRLSMTDTGGRGRFVPGDMIQDRYRIIGLIGVGGMGEVYRADDLKLDQPVALKFLPLALQQNPDRLSRFLHEVKIARQVSHANVCRVYDVGEFDGQTFLSMEFVDGEDLASLLRRIGRLSSDKAIDIARQISAGLAAAHNRGIVHRDLKPANVMLDGDGQVRITDFGLAGLASGITGAEIRAGTPGYMAPEQIEGREVSIRSDIYSLGHVLYELFTGKPAFEARSLAELRELQTRGIPTRPSTLVDQIDPAVERVILKCLEKDPADRPASALAVAVALPGGDPLAAALAAGETPSPELVAAAGEEGALAPARALACLATFLVALAAGFVVAPRIQLWSRLDLDKPPQALAVEARDLIRELGYDDPVDRVWSFGTQGDYLQKINRDEKSPDRWEELGEVRPSARIFWYRESPRPLVPVNFVGSASFRNPPLTISGMVRVMFDLQGNLLQLIAVPPQKLPDPDEQDPSTAAGEPDWSALFVTAGLSLSDFQEADPQWNPLVACDTRRAWTGAYPDRPETPIRIEAGSFGGRVTYFDTIAAWTLPGQMGVQPIDRSTQILNAILLTLLGLILLTGGILARRNLRQGRVDNKGAFRLATWVFGVTLIDWALGTHHVAATSEVGLFLLGGVPIGLLAAGIVVLIYLALEPFVRKLWPQLLISWSRLLAGRFRDPRVGRDLLFGLTAGLLLQLYEALILVVPGMLGEPGVQPAIVDNGTLQGPRQALNRLFEIQPNVLFVAMALLFLLLLFKAIFKREWAAMVCSAIVFAGILIAGNPENPSIWIMGLVYWIVVIVIMMRLGLLAGATTIFMSNLFWSFPLTWNLSVWFAPWNIAIVLVVLAVALWAFYAALAGRRIFSDLLPD